MCALVGLAKLLEFVAVRPIHLIEPRSDLVALVGAGLDVGRHFVSAYNLPAVQADARRKFLEILVELVLQETEEIHKLIELLRLVVQHDLVGHLLTFLWQTRLARRLHLQPKWVLSGLGSRLGRH